MTLHNFEFPDWKVDSSQKPKLNFFVCGKVTFSVVWINVLVLVLRFSKSIHIENFPILIKGNCSIYLENGTKLQNLCAVKSKKLENVRKSVRENARVVMIGTFFQHSTVDLRAHNFENFEKPS